MLTIRKLFRIFPLLVIVITPAAFSQPTAPLLSAPANGTPNLKTTVTLAWNTVSGASSYTLQVAASSDLLNPVVHQGGISAGTIVLGGFSYGTRYYWRVNATGGGQTGAWSAIWSFAVAPMPVTPALLAPANGATVSALTGKATWGTVDNADYYRMQISSSSTFAAVVIDQSLPESFRSLADLPPDTSWRYWRVGAANNISGQSAWSDVWKFRVGSGPSAPILVAPSNGTVNLSSPVALSWSSSTSGASYALVVSTDLSFGTSVFYQASTAMTHTSVSGLVSNVYHYWRVCAADSFGRGAWSGVWKFALAINQPSPPILATPSNGASGVAVSPAFSWQMAANVSSYALQVSTASNFSSTVFYASTLTGGSLASLSRLDNGTVYYWRMNASNEVGVGTWSATWSFATVVHAPELAPVLLSPTNQSSMPNPVKLSWGIVIGATSYEVKIGVHGRYPDITYTSSTVNAPEMVGSFPVYTGSSTPVYNTIFWSVRAINDGGYGPWSDTNSFTMTATGVLPSRAPAESKKFQVVNSAVSYEIAAPCKVSLSLFTLSGSRIVLFDRQQQAGRHSFSLKNRGLAQGAYFLFFQAGKESQMLKITLTK